MGPGVLSPGGARAQQAQGPSLGPLEAPLQEATPALSPQVPDWASEDEGLPPVPPPLGAAPKHSTPQGRALRRRGRPAGHVAYRTGAGLASASPPPTIPARPLSPPRRERRLSTVWDSEEASGRLGPDSDPRVPEEEPPGPASVPRRWQQQQEVSPGSGRRGKGLPGIPNSARPRRRDLKMLAAVVGPNPTLPGPSPSPAPHPRAAPHPHPDTAP